MASTGDNTPNVESLDDRIFSDPCQAVPGAVNDPEHAAEDSSSDEVQQVQPKLDNEDDNEHDSSEENFRSTRYRGPSSTWRFFTEDERALASSLDQQRANDLSIHLYNAHALKARVRNPNTTTKPEIKSYHGKKRWIKRDDDGKVPWHPDAVWTAWPLKAEDVPRKGESFGADLMGDGETFRKKVVWRREAEMEEEILAIMLEKAKERLRESKNKMRASEHVADAVDGAKELNRGSSHTGSDGDQSMEAASNPTERSEPESEGVAVPEDHHQQMDILADDEEAAAILEPSIRQVLSKLDDLLIGLHKSRRGHVRNASESRSRSSRSKSKSKSKSRSRAKPSATAVQPRYRRKRIVDSISATSNDETSSDSSTSPTTNSTQSDDHTSKKPKRKRPLNPRDWSEVLGVASLVGWDPDVVDRAAKRCAMLFGEGMDFRNRNPDKAVDGAPTATAEHDMLVDEVRAATVGNMMVVDEKPPVRVHNCPVESCARHREPFEKAWRWREHLKRSHKYGKDRIRELEAGLSNGDGAAAAE